MRAPIRRWTAISILALLLSGLMVAPSQAHSLRPSVTAETLSQPSASARTAPSLKNRRCVGPKKVHGDTWSCIASPSTSATGERLAASSLGPPFGQNPDGSFYDGLVLDDTHWRFSYDVLYGNVPNPTPVGEVNESATIALNGQQARITMALGRVLGPPIKQSMLFACQDAHTGNPGACSDSDPSIHFAAGFNVGVERFPGSPYAILPPNSDYVIKFDFREIAETTLIEYRNPVLTSAEIKCNSSQTPVCMFPPSTFGEIPAGTVGPGNATGDPINVGLQGGQTTTISYQAVGGQEMSLGLIRGTLGANTTVRVYDSNNTLLASDIVGSTGDIDYKNGAAGGTHRITFSPSSGSSSGRITLFISPATQSGAALGGASPTVPIGTPGQNAYITFVADTGNLASIGFTNNTFDNSLNVNVYKPDGTNFASEIVTGSGGLDLPKLPTGGNYRIRLDPRFSGGTSGTGSVTLTLSIAVSGSVVVNGANTTIAIVRTAQDAYVDFQGNAQQELSLALTNNTLMTHGTDMYIYKPDGATLTTKIATGNPDQLDPPKLPVSGTYRIRLNPRIREPNTGTGSVTLTLSTVTTGSITVGGSSTTITTTRPAQDAYLSFQGNAGQLLRLSLYQNSMSFYVDYAVYSPSGSQLKGGTITGSNGLAVDLPALPTTGTHRIRLNPRIQHSSTFGQGNMTVALAPR